MTIFLSLSLNRPISAQQSQQDSYGRCYNLTAATHCFRTIRGPENMMRKFQEAAEWCKERGYTLVKVDSPEVQMIVEKFIEDFELTSDDVWIGSRKTTQGRWTWVNGELFDNGNFHFLFL